MPSREVTVNITIARVQDTLYGRHPLIDLGDSGVVSVHVDLMMAQVWFHSLDIAKAKVKEVVINGRHYTPKRVDDLISGVDVPINVLRRLGFEGRIDLVLSIVVATE